MSDPTPAGRELFEGGPPHHFQTWVGLIRAGKPNVVWRALLVAALAWVPLAILSAANGSFVGPVHEGAFAYDIGAHARFLLAAPLLVLAESICLPQLTHIARHLIDAGLIADSDRSRYLRAVDSTRRLMNSGVIEILVVALAYGLIGLLAFGRFSPEAPAWHGSVQGGAMILSAAGWWGVLVSLPLLLILLLAWLWRLMLWARFLWLMSRIDLKLVPAHPDHAAGLRFVGESLQVLMPIGLSIGVIVAGPTANYVLHRSTSILDFKTLILGAVVFVLVLCAGPLLLFSNRLIAERRRGIFGYGALAVRLGTQMERKWLTPEKPMDADALGVPDFSATTDLYSIVANVYAMRIVPIDLKRLILLVVATLAPFIPVALLAVPLAVIVKKVAALLL